MFRNFLRLQNHKFNARTIINEALKQESVNKLELLPLLLQLEKNETTKEVAKLQAEATKKSGNAGSYAVAFATALGGFCIAGFAYLSFQEGKASDELKWIYKHHFGYETHGKSSEAMQELYRLKEQYEDKTILDEKERFEKLATAFGKEQKTKQKFFQNNDWKDMNKSRSITKDYFGGADFIESCIKRTSWISRLFSPEPLGALNELNKPDGIHNLRKQRYTVLSEPLSKKLEDEAKSLD